MPESVKTLAQLFLRSVAFNKPDHLLAKEEGRYTPISSAEFYRRVVRVHQALGRLGLRHGDCCAILSENRWEWALADFAMMTAGIVSVPLYPNLPANQIQYMLENSAARAVFVSTLEQREKVLSIWRRLPVLENVIAFEGWPGGAVSRIFTLPHWIGEDPVTEQDSRAFEAAAKAVEPDDLASILYTSGTTGTPKGVMLTHDNLVSNVLDAEPDFRPTDVALSFLPLCHIYERTIDYGYYLHGITVAHADTVESVPASLEQVRPTIVAAVPRFFEKSYQKLKQNLATEPRWRQKLFEWALQVGFESTSFRLENRPMPGNLRVRFFLADRLVFSKIRARMGGRIRQFLSGGAPLAQELAEFFYAVNLPVLEGYGLTETSPIVSANRPGCVRLGTVGKPLRNVEVRIAEDGEILVHGPNVMRGYYKLERETAEVMNDGWFHTGDIGMLDEDGFLKILDRKKDLLKTSGGKFIAPQPIENRLKNNPYIANALVIADRRQFPSALIVPNFQRLEEFAREKRIPYRSLAELAQRTETFRWLEQQVEEACKDLAPFERVKKITVLDRDFSIEAGEMTPTLKVRRREVESRFADVIEKMYQQAAN
ncbi:MAG: long-chain fatty acid--CoA ligase [Acidobacteria bacterium]|nr:long-chain fatty acid--CoA ligase [Acidobacteriota bacterium]